jgi:S-adenosyl-L-methionine hydrolase (adenosine-forming)
MPVITITTEWKPSDFYYGILRGNLYRLCPDAKIVENASGIPPFNISHAAFVIRNSYEHYPKESIHIICVHTELGANQDFVIVRAKNHYFIGTDNGIFNLILNSDPETVVKITNNGNDDELFVFAKAAADLLSGQNPAELGTTLKGIRERVPLRATIDKDVIIGSVIFIDSYGNAFTNITKEIFNRIFEKRDYNILIQSNKYYTNHICRYYSDEPVGELLSRFNSLDLLEIAINGTDASELLNLTVGSVVRVELANKSTSSQGLF